MVRATQKPTKLTKCPITRPVIKTTRHYRTKCNIYCTNMLEIRDTVAEQTIYTFWAEAPINITSRCTARPASVPWNHSYTFRHDSFAKTHYDFIRCHTTCCIKHSCSWMLWVSDYSVGPDKPRWRNPEGPEYWPSAHESLLRSSPWCLWLKKRDKLSLMMSLHL